MSASGILSAFFRNERGAASVDWVVLAAACVGMGIGVTNVVEAEMSELSQHIRASLHQDMLRNPFDIDETPLGSIGCTHLYIDPLADPAVSEALANYHATSGCAVSTTVSASENTSVSMANNGFGNGDQVAPGGSGAHNNAENALTN